MLIAVPRRRLAAAPMLRRTLRAASSANSGNGIALAGHIFRPAPSSLATGCSSRSMAAPLFSSDRAKRHGGIGRECLVWRQFGRAHAGNCLRHGCNAGQVSVGGPSGVPALILSARKPSAQAAAAKSAAASGENKRDCHIGCHPVPAFPPKCCHKGKTTLPRPHVIQGHFQPRPRRRSVRRGAHTPAPAAAPAARSAFR